MPCGSSWKDVKMMQVTRDTDARKFNAQEPEQAAFRSALSKLTDDQIIEIENDLGVFARTGMMAQALVRFLDSGSGMAHAA